MPFLELGQQSIYYAQQAPGDKNRRYSESLPTVVLIHAAGGSHLDWPPQLRRIPVAMVYAIDLPGHGRSTGECRPSIDGYASDLHDFIKNLDLENVVLVGHSMGGAIVQTIAIQHPAILRGQVLISTGARLRVREEFRVGITVNFESTVELLTRYLWAEETPEALKRFSQDTLLAKNPEVIQSDYEACHRFDSMGRLAEITLPTLVICGTQDQMTPLKYSRYLSQNISGARLKIIDGGGHMVTLERPLAVSKTIQAFLREIIPELNGAE